MKRKALLAALVCCIANVSFGQIVLTGKVVDENDEPVMGATVRFEKTTLGTLTDDNGNFRLESASSQELVMRASRIDYEATKMNVSGSEDNLKVVLKPSYLNLNEVVVTGTGTHHKLKNSPVAVETVSAKDIINTASATIEDALSSLTSAISTKGAANITLNGLSNKHILILVDGKKIAGETSGDNDLTRIDMSNVKRIEIVKGGASSLYGSDAMGGVINIITSQPQSLFDISSYTKYSRYNQFNEAVNVGIKYNKISSQTSYQRKQTDGWQLNDKEITSKGELKETDKQAVTGFHSNIVSQQFNYRPTEKLSFYTKGSFYDKKTDRAYSAYTYDMDYKDYNFALGGQYLLGGTDYISFDSYFDNYEYGKDYFKDEKEIAAGATEMTKRQRYFNNVLKGVFSLGKQNKLNTGVEYLSDYLKNPTSLTESKNAYTLSLYAQDEYKVIKHFHIVAGFRFIHHETFKNRFTPKLSVMYSAGNFRFRGSYASGFRTPNLMELFYDYGGMGGTTISKGNKDLKPEKSNYFSINTEYSNDFISLSVTGYINNIKDIIERKSMPLEPGDEEAGIKSRYQYINASKARTQGVDFSFNAYLTHGFTLALNYSYVDALNRDDNTPLFGSSRHTGTVAANWTNNWKKYKLNINLNGRLQDEAWYPPSSNKYIDNIARPYQIWNLSTTHTFSGLKGFILEPGFGMENIFDFQDDKPFGNRYATTSPGRTVYASLIVKFKK